MEDPDLSIIYRFIIILASVSWIIWVWRETSTKRYIAEILIPRTTRTFIYLSVFLAFSIYFSISIIPCTLSLVFFKCGLLKSSFSCLHFYSAPSPILRPRYLVMIIWSIFIDSAASVDEIGVKFLAIFVE